METEFDEIYEKYKDDVYRLSYSYTKKLAEAEDITQEVFLKFFKNKEKLEKKELIKYWLIKVTLNECKTHFLSSWKKKTFFLGEETEVREEKRNEEILPMILALPKKERVLIHLYYYEGYKIEEIASILHISISNCKTRLYRIRKKLKEELKD